MMLRQAKRWPRILLVGNPRVANWSGRRIWTQEWCFVPVRQNVESKPLAARLRRKDEYDRMRQTKYRIDRGSGCSYRFKAAQAVGVSSGSL